MSDEVPVTIVASNINKKKEEKHKRRDPRSWENIKKATSGMTEEERIQYFAKMYLEMYNENRSLFHNLQAREKQLQSLQKDKDREHAELTKSILARGQLESLCRELQKQNKLIKAALMKLGKEPPVDEDDATEVLTPLVEQDFEVIHREIEKADHKIEEHLAGDSGASDLRPKRFDNTTGMKGEGDIPLPGPSHRDDSIDASKSLAEIETQTKTVSTQDMATQSTAETVEVALQPFVHLHPIAAGADESLAVRRAHAATDLIREQIPCEVNLNDTDSQSSVATYEAPNFNNMDDQVDDGLEDPVDFDEDDDDSSPDSNGVIYPDNAEHIGVQTVSSSEALLMSDSVINLTDDTGSSSSTLEDDISPRPLVVDVEDEERQEDARKRKQRERDYDEDWRP